MRWKIFSFFQPALPILPYIIVFIGSLYRPHDPDLGWHLKYGEYFFNNHQILRTNTFSQEMPTYHWINSSWATDIITYATFHIGSFFGLTVLAAFIITLTFFFFAKAARLSFWEETLLFPLLLYYEDPLSSVSFRGQLMSILFSGILFFLLSRYGMKKSKKLFFIPLLFILWSNTHGEFLLGLAIFSLWIGVKAIQIFFISKNIANVFSQLSFLFIVLFFSIFAVIINPFGIGVYQEALRHFGSPLLKYIVEWLPFDEFSQMWWNHIIMTVLIFLGIVFLFFQGNYKQRYTVIAIAAVLFTLSFLGRRYAWPTYYFTLPLLVPLTIFFTPDKKKNQQIAAMFLLPLVLIVIIFQKLPFTQFTNMSWNTYCQKYMSCSDKAVEFLLSHKLPDKLLTVYDWGGWIIWNYPQLKPTIDGRMHLWKDEKGYSAYLHYYSYEQNWKDIDLSEYNTVLMIPGKPLFKRMVELVNEGKWQIVYHDKYAGVFIRRESGKVIVLGK